MKIIKDEIEYDVADGHDWFWSMFADNTWEPNTFKIFDRYLSKNRAYMDIGAWIGPTVLYGASRAKKVYAFEPDSVAYDSLVKNITLNNVGNVWCAPVGVSSQCKMIRLGVRTAAGDSMSSILWGNSDRSVPSVSFSMFVQYVNPNFIKIDIEGGEIDVLVDAHMILKALQPTVHLSLHTPWFQGESLEKYKTIIKQALSHYPIILNDRMEETTVDAMLCEPGFVSFIATYEK
jgi:FkbM family methyltransferase